MKYFFLILGSLGWWVGATTLSASELEGPGPSQVTNCFLEHGALRSGIETCTELYEKLEATERHAVAEKLVSTCMELGELDTMVRQAACFNSLFKIGSLVIPALIEVLDHPQSSVRQTAVGHLAQMEFQGRGHDPRIGTALSRALVDPSEDVRRAAIGGLFRISHLLPEVPEAVLELLEHGDERMRVQASRIVLNVDRESPEGITAMVTLLETGDPDSVRSLTPYLERAGPAARAALPALKRLLDYPEARVRLDAARAISGIDPSSAAPTPVLLELLSHPHNGVRSAAVDSLVALDAQPEAQIDAAIPYLIAALEDEDGNVVMQAVQILGKLGEQAAPAVAKIGELLEAQGNHYLSGPMLCLPLKRIGTPEALSLIESNASCSAWLESIPDEILQELNP